MAGLAAWGAGLAAGIGTGFVCASAGPAKVIEKAREIAALRIISTLSPLPVALYSLLIWRH